MNESLKGYYDNLQKPWSKLFYRVVLRQLSFVKNQKVLDYGSGFGILSDALAQSNEVIAVEPNGEMAENRSQSHLYTQMIGGLEQLKRLDSNCFDVITCHNVLEYVEEREETMREFGRVLKPDGLLSVVKHNHSGRIMQKIVFENQIDEALALLRGGDSIAQSFGKINYYKNSELVKWNSRFALDKVLGLRTFWGLQQNNEIKYDASWQNKMIEAELAVSEMEEFIKISFSNHVFLRLRP